MKRRRKIAGFVPEPFDFKENQRMLAMQRAPEDIPAWLKSRGWKLSDWNIWEDPDGFEFVDMPHAVWIQRARDAAKIG